MLQRGTRLNDTYTLLEIIGSGGGGVVYKADHERLKTYVVVKQVRDRVKGRLDSRAEADILKNIKHTHLPRVYDFLEINGEIYTVMDYIPGKTLAQVLKEKGYLGQRDVLKWALQLADALNYLHSQNPPVIHSDIKPANIMLQPDGNVCLIDFNVSLVFDKELRSSTGISGGYSPPEQYKDINNYRKYIKEDKNFKIDRTKTLTGLGVQAENDETLLMEVSGTYGDRGSTRTLTEHLIGRGVDERSDVYSLGATLYHLLTGVKPDCNFDEIVPITDYDINLSEGLGLIINKMLDIEPDCRYQSGGQVLYALEHIYELDSEYRRYRRKVRNRTGLIASLYVMGGILAGIGWIRIQNETTFAYNRAVEQAGEYIKEKDFNLAQKEIKKAFLLRPDRIGGYEKELLKLYTIGDYDEAVSYGRDIINNPSYVLRQEDLESEANIFYIMGNAYFEQKDYDNAARCFAEAIDRNRNNSSYFRDYAVTLAKNGNTDRAQEALDMAIALGLGQDSVYMVQGEVAFAKGDDQTAVERMKLSMETTKDEVLLERATLLCVQAYKRMGEDSLDERIHLLEKSINQFGSEVSMHISEELADAYAQKAKISESMADIYYPKALEQFQKICDQGYTTRQVLENMAILYQQMDQLDQAENVLQKLAENYPDDYRAFKRLAFLEADRQQKKENKNRSYQQMQIYYEKAMELYQKNTKEDDTEMQMLQNLMRDLKDGGWF